MALWMASVSISFNVLLMKFSFRKIHCAQLLLLDIRFEQQLYTGILQGVPLNDLRDATSLFVREIIAELIC